MLDCFVSLNEFIHKVEISFVIGISGVVEQLGEFQDEAVE